MGENKIVRHKLRAHSKFSASGAERWFKCPGSVSLSEGLPDKESDASRNGTNCHELLEARLKGNPLPIGAQYTQEMKTHSRVAADYILGLKERAQSAELLVEKRVSLSFIHPEAFGTVDASIVEYFGRLNVNDFKYGTHLVSPEKNLQLIFYALGIGRIYDWNFSTVRLTIIQPRVRGYDGPSFWEIGIFDLLKYIDVFKRAVERVEEKPNEFSEGEHCFFCKAKSICPLKRKGRREKSKSAFLNTPID